jgi:predicted XRE-type DNA-binding protein
MPTNVNDLIKKRRPRSKRTRRATNTEIEVTEGSGNVFADLGLPNASELFARAQIRFRIHKIVKARKLTQRDIAKLLDVKRSEASYIMNGRYGRFTTDQLRDFLKLLDAKPNTDDLQSLAAGITPDNLHPEIDFGPPLGKEYRAVYLTAEEKTLPKRRRARKRTKSRA